MPGLERPPAGAHRVGRPAAPGGCSDWRPCSAHVAPLLARPERPPPLARRDEGPVASERVPPGPERPPVELRRADGPAVATRR
eukprot:15456906-Alexandrium_andersonii.AAC.1